MLENHATISATEWRTPCHALCRKLRTVLLSIGSVEHEASRTIHACMLVQLHGRMGECIANIAKTEQRSWNCTTHHLFRNFFQNCTRMQCYAVLCPVDVFLHKNWGLVHHLSTGSGGRNNVNVTENAKPIALQCGLWLAAVSTAVHDDRVVHSSPSVNSFALMSGSDPVRTSKQVLWESCHCCHCPASSQTSQSRQFKLYDKQSSNWM